MEEERRYQSMTYQKLDVAQYDWESGVVGVAKWQEEVAMALNQIPATEGTDPHVLSSEYCSASQSNCEGKCPGTWCPNGPYPAAKK